MSDNRSFYSQRDRQAERESAALQEKMRMPTRGSSSTDSEVTSPPPISLGSRAKVDLKGKQKLFEEQDRNTARDSAVRIARTRPKSWGPGEIDKLIKRSNQRDVSFKDKHLKYEQLQRQADTESATLQGKIRPQLSADSRDGPSKTKAVLPTRADVQLGDKRRKFEKLDHQAQKDSAVLRGEHRVADGKAVRRQSSGNADPTLRRKQEMFENLERQASEDMETLQGKRRLSTSDREHSKRSSGVFLPKDAEVKLGDKKSKFEELDQQAQKESKILRMNQSRSTGSLDRESRSFGSSYRPHEEISNSSSENVFREREPLTRHQRPNNYEYQYSGNVAPYIKDISTWESTEEPIEITPSTNERHLNDSEIPSRADDTPQLTEEVPRRLGRTARFTRERYGNDSFDFGDPTEYHPFGEEQIQPESASVDESAPEQEAQNLSYRDFVQQPPREKREGFASRKQPSFDDIDNKPPREERNGKRVAEKDERLHSGGFSYNDYVPVPKGGQRKKKFLQELEREEDPTEMPWRQEVRQLKGRPPREEIVPPRRAAESSLENDRRISSQRAVNPVPKSGSLKRDAYLRELEREKGVREMPWRQEVKELKERSPREEEPEEQSKVHEPMFESPDGLDVRNMKYRDFSIVPHRSVKRDTFVREERNEKREEEMPWRQELRDLRDRPPTEEQVEPSIEHLTESAYDKDEVNFSYRDFVPVKHGNPKSNEFLREAERDKDVDEMPWRQEVRELKSSSAREDLSEDRPIPDDHMETAVSPSPRKMSYRDFSRPPPSKSRDTFVSESQKADEEMPWRTEVRELQKRGPREEVQDEDTETRRSRGRPREYSKPSPPPRSKSYSALDGRKLSYHDFVCPPSMMNRDSPQEKAEQIRKPKNDAPQKRYKVQDLTRRFTEIEADQLRPKEGGIPSRKSLVNKDELERIEREMKTRTWHGFPAEYSDHVHRRSSLTDNHEDGFPYRTADISADDYHEVFEDPEVLFEKHERNAAPTEFRQEPMVQNAHAKSEQVDEGYKFHPYSQGERKRQERMYSEERYLQDDFDKPEQVPVGRVTALSREYPKQRPHYDHEEGKSVYQRGDNAPRNQKQYRMVDRAGERKPSRDSEAHRYQQQQQDRNVFQPQTTSVLNSMPEPPMERKQRPPNKNKAADAPRNSAQGRTIYLWSNDNEVSQEPPLQRFDQFDNVLNAAPMRTDGNSGNTAEPCKWGFEDGERNDRMPQQNMGNEHGNAPKEMASSKASDLKDRPLTRIRPNVFAIVGKNNQVPQLHSNPSGPTQDVQLQDRDRQMHPNRKQEANNVPRKDAQQGQLAKARVLDINKEQLDRTRNGDGGGYPYGRQGAWNGTGEKMIESETLKDVENRDLNPETEQVYLKKQLRDADYRAKLRNELTVTNRKHRESAQYLLSQMQASYTSEGEQESDENDKHNNHTDGFVDERYNRPPQNGSIRDGNLMDMVEEERSWKEKREREQELAQRGRHRSERFNGHSDPHRRDKKEEGTTAQETERFMIEKNQPQKQQPENDIVEPLIEPMKKPPQTFSLNELSDIFREDTDEQDRSREPETSSKFQNDRPMYHNGPTLGNKGYHKPQKTRDVSNGYDRYDLKNDFDRNCYAGYDYPEPVVHSQRNGVKENKHYKVEVRPQNSRPSRKDNSRPDRHSKQYAPVEVKPAKKNVTSLRDGPLENGYPKPQTRSRIRGTEEGDKRSDTVDKPSKKNGPLGYNIYETFVHGESNHVVCEYCGTTIEKSISMFVAEVNKYWHLHCFQCVVCQAPFDEHSSHILQITDSRLHCERCFITEEGERCTEV